MHFQPSHCDAGFFFLYNQDSTFAAALLPRVDDVLIAGSPTTIAKIKIALQTKFQMHDVTGGGKPALNRA